MHFVRYPGEKRDRRCAAALCLAKIGGGFLRDGTGVEIPSRSADGTAELPMATIGEQLWNRSTFGSGGCHIICSVFCSLANRTRASN
jgi:hypothetical protein